MYHVIINSPLVSAVYDAHKQLNLPDVPEMPRGHQIKQLEALNDILIDAVELMFSAENDDESNESYEPDNSNPLGIDELFYEVFIKYVPTGRYATVRIMDRYGNAIITIED